LKGELREQKSGKKILKYRKPLNFNIGLIIFVFIFIYILVSVISYFQSDPVRGYEVREGSLSTNHVYRGIVIRKEEVVPAEESGTVNYILREGERVAKGDLVYVVDGAGKLREYLDQTATYDSSAVDNTADLMEFRRDIMEFMHSFDPERFQGVYEFQDTISALVSNMYGIEMIEALSRMDGTRTLSDIALGYGQASQTGIVAYWEDGYEDLTPEAVNASMWEDPEYQRKMLVGGELLAQGETAYKLSTDEHWSVMIKVEPEEGLLLEQEEFIKVRFLKNQYESWGEAALIRNDEGDTFLQLQFTNSMITFLSERFLDIELILHDEVGLKIPNSAIAQEEFYLVPEDFLITGGQNGSSGVLRRSFLEDGTQSVDFVETDINFTDEETGECYLDIMVLMPGDILVKQDSQETFTVSRRATLIGVYNMNKGYADFKEIQILYQNEEYAIVKSNTMYGLNVYDYIVLDAQSVDNEQFIYQ
jgi:hypothetical protein